MEFLLTKPLDRLANHSRKILCKLCTRIFCFAPNTHLLPLRFRIGRTSRKHRFRSSFWLVHWLASTRRSFYEHWFILFGNHQQSDCLFHSICFSELFSFTKALPHLPTFRHFLGVSYSLSQLGIDYHYSSISSGLVDSRNLIYFFGLMLLMLSATKLVLGSRKW